MRRIATEEAFVTPEILSAWSRLLADGPVEPGFRKMGESILKPGPGTQRVHDRLLDLDAGRIAHMDQDGIAMEVLSLTSPGVQAFEPAQASALAAHANDVLAEAIRRHPRRLAGLAAIAPHDPRGAVAEMERARSKLGLRGLIINSHTMGEYLDAPKYRPVLEAAAALDLPIYLHPREPGPGMVQPYLDYGLYFAGWGFAAETSLHALRLIMSGTFARVPRLRIVLGHLGEGLPFWLKRIDNRYQLQCRIGAIEPLPRLPSEYFLDHFVITTSGMTSAPAMELCLQVMGAERILFAADYPYEDAAEAVQFLDHAAMDSEQREQIYHRNAERVFGLAMPG